MNRRVPVPFRNAVAPLDAALTSGAPSLVSLTYVATASQATFSLSTPDRFGVTAVMSATTSVEVFAGGDRLAPDDGTGFGGYTASVTANSITLLHPVSAGEVVQVDVFGAGPWPSEGVPSLFNDIAISQLPQAFPLIGTELIPLVQSDPLGGLQTCKAPLELFINMLSRLFGATEALTVTSTNVLPPLTFTPDGALFVLFVNGQAFFSVGPQAAFYLNGTQIVWTSSIYTINPGAAVVALYTHFGFPSFPSAEGSLGITLSGDVTGLGSTGVPVATTARALQGSPVAATAPAANQVLTWVSGQWTPAVVPAAPVSSVAGRTGAVTLTHSDLTDWASATAAFATTTAVAAGYLPITSPTAQNGLTLTNTLGPLLIYKTPGAPTDQTMSRLLQDNNGNVEWQLINDAYSSAANILVATRSGYSLTNLAFGANWLTCTPTLITANNSTAFNSGIAFGSVFGPGSTDCSKHIALYGAPAAPWGGINVTSGEINFIAGSAVQFYLDGVTIHCQAPLSLARSQFQWSGVTSVSGATSLAWTNGEYQRISLTGNATIAVTGWPASGNFAKLVIDIANTGAFNITGWPTGTIWAGAAGPPTITSGAGKRDVIMLTTPDGGTTVFGNLIGQNFG